MEEPKSAEQQKVFLAEQQIAGVRLVIIVFGTIGYLLLDNPFIKTQLANVLLGLIWAYGIFILLYKPYEKHPVFLAGWFTYVSDCVFATLWIYSTGGYFSPFHVLYYTSVIAVSFRFGIKTTLFTATLYTLCYFGLLLAMQQLSDHHGIVMIRTGFIFIIGLFTYQITRETLVQTQQKLAMKKLAEKAEESKKQLQQSQEELRRVNHELLLRNNIFNHAEENARIGSYAWDLEQNDMRYSDNFFRLLGYHPGEFRPQLERYMEMVLPEDRAMVTNTTEQVKQNKTEVVMHYRIRTKTGEICHMRTTAKIIEEAGTSMMIGTMQDVSSDVAMSESMKLKNEELKRNNKELESFSYIASHDLQEPVRKIHTFSSLLLDKEKDNLSQTGVDYLKRIGNSAKRMQGLIEAFLNYSRMENMQLNFEPTDLNKVVNEAIQQLSDRVSEAQATIDVGPLPTLQAVPLQMQQLFVNLLSNAIKYHAPGQKPFVEVRSQAATRDELPAEKQNDGQEWFRITVSDNGIGFEPQYAGKIFEVFQRLHSKDQFAGTGIGLAICKKVVNMHNGIIYAESEPNQGATFTILLPASNG